MKPYDKDSTPESLNNYNSVKIQTIDFFQKKQNQKDNQKNSLIPLNLFRSLNDKSKREISQSFEITNKSPKLRYISNSKKFNAKFLLRNPKNFQNLFICKTINNTARTRLEFESKSKIVPVPIIHKKKFDDINKMFVNYKIKGSKSNNSKNFQKEEEDNYISQSNITSTRNKKETFVEKYNKHKFIFNSKNMDIEPEKDEENLLQKENFDLKFKIDKLNITLQSLLEENNSLKRKIQSYRTLMREYKEALHNPAKEEPKKDQINVNDQPLNSPSCSPKSFKFIFATRNSDVDSKSTELLFNWLLNLTGNDDMRNTLDKIHKDLPSILGFNKVQVYFINSLFKRLYHEKFPSTTPSNVFYLKEGIIEEFANKNNNTGNNKYKPRFDSMDELMKGFVKPNLMCLPVLYDSKNKNEDLLLPFLALQFEEKIGSSIYVNNNEIMMGKLVCFILSIIINNFIQEILRTEYNTMENRFLNFIGKVYGETNPQIISDLVNKYVSSIYNAENSILLISKNNCLDLLQGTNDSNNQRFTKNIIEFPIASGITGKSFQTKEIIYITNPYIEPFFNPIVDNISDIEKIRNITFIPLLNREGQSIAEVHIINKLNDFNEDYKESVKNLKLIIGKTIENAKMYNDTYNLLINLDKGIKDLVNISEKNENELYGKSSNVSKLLFNQIQKISDIITLMEGNKKNFPF